MAEGSNANETTLLLEESNGEDVDEETERQVDVGVRRRVVQPELADADRQDVPRHVDVRENSHSEVQEPQHRFRKAFIIVSVLVQIILLLKVPLYILHQPLVNNSLNHFCFKPINGSNSDDSEDISRQYIFTVVIYSFVSGIGKCIEVLIIHFHIYKFVFHQTEIKLSEFKKLCHDCLSIQVAPTNLVLFICLALYMLLHSLSVPGLGMALAYKQTPNKFECYIYHFCYWVLDIVCYLNDVTIRLLMVLATFAAGRLWHINKLQQSSGQQQLIDMLELTEDHDALHAGDNCNAEPTQYDNYLKDKEVISHDHQLRTKKYSKIGNKVQPILEIFQAWFIFPWFLFFITTLLDSHYILKAWRDSKSQQSVAVSDNVSHRYDLAAVMFMVYNFNQISLLVVAYMCSKIMNTNHHEYFLSSRKEQIKKFQTSSRKALGSMNEIEKEDNFDFIPRIWGSGIKIQINNPFYFVTLFAHIFFVIMERLV